MDIEQFKLPAPSSPPQPERIRTAQRLKYDAEIRVFTNKFGDLENVRKTLGFSRRQMCQLLLVDPSAWSRWHSAGHAPPPHVYRALEWFLIIEGRTELHPRVADIYLKGTSRGGASTSPSEAEHPAVADLNLRVTELQSRIARLHIFVAAGPVVALVVTGLLYWFIR